MFAGKADKATTLAGYGITDAYTKDATDKMIAEALDGTLTGADLKDLNDKTINITATQGVTNIEGQVVVNEDEDQQVVIDEEGITVGTQSVRIDNNGVYAGAHNYEDAAAAISADGKIKAANGLFEVYTDGTMVAQSGVFANGAVRIDGDGTLRVGGSGNNANVIIYKEGPTSISAKGEIHAGSFATSGDVVANGAVAGGAVVSTGQIVADGDIVSVNGNVVAGDVSLKDLEGRVEATEGAITQAQKDITANADAIKGLDGRVEATEGAITEVQSNVADITTALDSKANVADVNNAIADVEKGYQDADAALKAEVEKGYQDADAQTLADAKGYADEKAAEVTEAYQAADEAIKTDVKANADAIEGLGGRVDKHDEAISGLNQRLGKMNGKVNKVGAGAAALAALHPLEYDPDDKLTFSAGVGNYNGENAAALGAFYRPDEKLMFSLGGTMGNGENMVNLGVSIGLDGAKGAPKLSRKELVEKVNNMEAEKEELLKRIARLERIVVSMVEKEDAK